MYDKTRSPNILVGPPRLLSESMANFQQGQEEVSLQATRREFVVTNTLEHDQKK